MANEEMMGMAPEGEELLAEEPVGEEEEEAQPGTVMTHTGDEVPELVGKAIGDVVTFRVANVSDDGNTFDLEYVSEEPLPTEGAAGEAPIGGREAIAGGFV